MTTANVYPQRPDSGAKAESSLHQANLAGLIGKGRKNPGVTVREKKLLGHLTLRGDAKDPAFAEGVHKALGLEYAGRDASAAPACGYASMHAEQQEKLLQDAFTV